MEVTITKTRNVQRSFLDPKLKRTTNKFFFNLGILLQHREKAYILKPIAKPLRKLFFKTLANLYPKHTTTCSNWNPLISESAARLTANRAIKNWYTSGTQNTQKKRRKTTSFRNFAANRLLFFSRATRRKTSESIPSDRPTYLHQSTLRRRQPIHNACRYRHEIYSFTQSLVVVVVGGKRKRNMI